MEAPSWWVAFEKLRNFGKKLSELWIWRTLVAWDLPAR